MGTRIIEVKLEMGDLKSLVDVLRIHVEERAMGLVVDACDEAEGTSADEAELIYAKYAAGVMGLAVSDDVALLRKFLGLLHAEEAAEAEVEAGGEAGG